MASSLIIHGGATIWIIGFLPWALSFYKWTNYRRRYGLVIYFLLMTVNFGVKPRVFFEAENGPMVDAQISRWELFCWTDKVKCSAWFFAVGYVSLSLYVMHCEMGLPSYSNFWYSDWETMEESISCVFGCHIIVLVFCAFFPMILS